ncbi:MAG: hypothetical protein KAS22_01615 [Candidatus Heimdallarchaeota archaeon]|nr:hypothetical protein [Candidatus Heimdallarchaeota archaeon]
MNAFGLKIKNGILKSNYSYLIILIGILSIAFLSAQIRFPNTNQEVIIIDPNNDHWEIPTEAQMHKSIGNIKINDDDDKEDLDNDGLPDSEEYKYQCNPNIPDSDGDGLLDGAEVYIYKTLPSRTDSDNDYLWDSWEIFTYFTHPMLYDTDQDGLCDGIEVLKHKSNPFHSDTDYDSLDDYSEVRTYFTDIHCPDTDKDGLSDGDEINTYNSNPLKADTDGDLLKDEWEVMNNHNPNRYDNYQRIFGLYVSIPGIALALIFLAIFGSLRLKTINVFRFKSDFEKEAQIEQDKQVLFELLSRVPEDQEIDVRKLAELTHETEDEILRLLSCIFDSDGDNGSELTTNDIVFKTSSEKQDFSITCFYCNNPVDIKKDQCDYCEEKIVRCKECDAIVTYTDVYAVCTSCGVIGEPEDITGFLSVEIICEKCLVQSRYFYV